MNLSNLNREGKKQIVEDEKKKGFSRVKNLINSRRKWKTKDTEK